MSIPSYSGHTYVAYLDISGFKEMMKNKNKARSVLDRFYKTIYGTLYEMTPPEPLSSIRINAVVVSDCAVLFLSCGSNGGSSDVDRIEGLPRILESVRKMNRAFLNHSYPFMTTCSIAYGDFHYENRSDREYLRKNCLMGTAYLNAFSDSESSESKSRPGECRVLKNELNLACSQNPIFTLLKSTRKYYYFYWMLENSRDIRSFIRKYNSAWEDLYEGLIRLLKNPNDRMSAQRNRSL